VTGFGARAGCAWRETDAQDTDLETLSLETARQALWLWQVEGLDKG
jgi:hypothetical protein